MQIGTIGVIGAGEVGNRCVVITGIIGDGIGEVPGRVHSSVQNIDDTVADLLAREMGGDDGGDIVVIGPWHRVDPAGMGDHDGVIASRCDCGNHRVAVSVYIVRDPVLAFSDISL